MCNPGTEQGVSHGDGEIYLEIDVMGCADILHVEGQEEGGGI